MSLLWAIYKMFNYYLSCKGQQQPCMFYGRSMLRPSWIIYEFGYSVYLPQVGKSDKKSRDSLNNRLLYL